MPSTMRRLSSNGCPLRPSFEGSKGATRSHCSFVNWVNLDLCTTYQACCIITHRYKRHALVPDVIAIPGFTMCVLAARALGSNQRSPIFASANFPWFPPSENLPASSSVSSTQWSGSLMIPSIRTAICSGLCSDQVPAWRGSTPSGATYTEPCAS